MTYCSYHVSRSRSCKGNHFSSVGELMHQACIVCHPIACRIAPKWPNGSDGSRKNIWGLGPSSFGRQIKNLGAWARFGGTAKWCVKFRKIFRGHKPGPPYIWQWSIHRYNQMVTEYGDMARPGLGILYGRSTAVCSTEFPLGSRDCSDFIQCRLKSRIRFALNGTDQFYIFIYLS